MSQIPQVTKDKLVSDFKLVVADTEELLRATAGIAGDRLSEVRGKLQDNLAIAKVKLDEAESVVIDKAKIAGRCADDYVNDNPWRSVGIAAGIGLVIGLLIGRR